MKSNNYNYQLLWSFSFKSCYRLCEITHSLSQSFTVCPLHTLQRNDLFADVYIHIGLMECSTKNIYTLHSLSSDSCGNRRR